MWLGVPPIWYSVYSRGRLYPPARHRSQAKTRQWSTLLPSRRLHLRHGAVSTTMWRANWRWRSRFSTLWLFVCLSLSQFIGTLICLPGGLHAKYVYISELHHVKQVIKNEQRKLILSFGDVSATWPFPNRWAHNDVCLHTTGINLPRNGLTSDRLKYPLLDFSPRNHQCVDYCSSLSTIVCPELTVANHFIFYDWLTVAFLIG